MNIDELEKKIDAAIKGALEDGLEIKPESYGISADYEIGKWVADQCSCCPLAAVVLASQKEKDVTTNLDIICENEPEEAVKTILGVDHTWVYGFITGFDDEKDDPAYDNDAYELGRKFRRRYL